MIDTTIILLCLALALLASMLLNVFFIWYLRGLIGTLNFFSDNLGDLLEILDEFRDHLGSVYNLETFYGDQVLHSLILHSRQVAEQIEEFGEIIIFSEETETEEGELMNDQEQTNETESTAGPDQEKKIAPQIKVQF